MRKMLLSIAIAITLFSCELDIFDNTTIHNNTAHTINFEFLAGNSRTLTIPPNETETYYSHGAKIAKFSNRQGRISYNLINDDEGEFFDTIPMSMEIRNTLNIPIILSENNNSMDTNNVSIPANGTLVTVNIYTKYPYFVTVPLSKTNFVIGGDTMYVTIY